MVFVFFFIKKLMVFTSLLFFSLISNNQVIKVYSQKKEKMGKSKLYKNKDPAKRKTKCNCTSNGNDKNKTKKGKNEYKGHWRLGLNPNRASKAKEARKNIAKVSHRQFLETLTQRQFLETRQENERQFLETQQETEKHEREERHQSEMRALYEQLYAQQQ
jgi:hypothetical protein